MKYLNDRCIVSDDNVFYYDSEQEITQADVMRFILENEQLAREYAKMRRYYKADHDAIVKAKQKPNNKPDNRLVLNYPKKLVDTFTGFAVGKPVQMTLPEELGNEALSKFNVSRKMDSVIARVWKESCIYGRAYFYVYSHDSEIYVTDALPLDTFVIYDNTVAHKPLYAVRYGHIGASASYKLTVFSESYQWESDTSRNTSGFGSRVVNPFGMIPIIEAVENDERLSVIKNVLPLIDEIDKADLEFPNDLLWELDRMEFYIPETKETVRAKQRPVVIITSNAEKELPDAFLRRCIFHYIDFPDQEQMERILHVHFDHLEEELLRQAMAAFYWIRELRGIDKKPSTSELVDWLRALTAGGADPARVRKEIPFAGVLLKKDKDLRTLRGSR